MSLSSLWTDGGNLQSNYSAVLSIIVMSFSIPLGPSAFPAQTWVFIAQGSVTSTFEAVVLLKSLLDTNILLTITHSISSSEMLYFFIFHDNLVTQVDLLVYWFIHLDTLVILLILQNGYC